MRIVISLVLGLFLITGICEAESKLPVLMQLSKQLENDLRTQIDPLADQESCSLIERVQPGYTKHQWLKHLDRKIKAREVRAAKQAYLSALREMIELGRRGGQDRELNSRLLKEKTDFLCLRDLYRRQQGGCAFIPRPWQLPLGSSDVTLDLPPAGTPIERFPEYASLRQLSGPPELGHSDKEKRRKAALDYVQNELLARPIASLEPEELRALVFDLHDHLLGEESTLRTGMEFVYKERPNEEFSTWMVFERAVRDGNKDLAETLRQMADLIYRWGARGDSSMTLEQASLVPTEYWQAFLTYVDLFPMPDQVPRLLKEYEEDALARMRDTQTHPYKVAAHLLNGLIRIHPFEDGNGRTALLLTNMYLMQQGLPPWTPEDYARWCVLMTGATEVELCQEFLRSQQLITEKALL